MLSEDEKNCNSQIESPISPESFSGLHPRENSNLKTLIVAFDESEGALIKTAVEEASEFVRPCEIITSITDASAKIEAAGYHIIILSAASSFGKWFEDALELKKSSRGSFLITIAEPDFLDMGLKGFDNLSDYSIARHEMSRAAFSPIIDSITRKLDNLKKIKSREVKEIDGTAFMAHEIKGVLSSIQGFVNALYSTCPDSIQKKYLDHIILCTDTMASCADIAAGFSSLKSEKFDIAYQSCSLEEIATGICIIEFEKAAKKGIKLYCQIDNNIDFKVMANVSSLRHAVLNLVENSIKYTGSGEIKLQIIYGGSFTDSASGNVMERITICVTDSGKGISREEIGKLFTPYYRCKSEVEGKGDGTGLGLYISNKLVKLMGGSGIAVSSEPGRGSSFWFSLGLKKVNGSAAAGYDFSRCCILKNYELLRHDKKLKVLYSEDNEYNAETIKKLLSMAGHDVRHVESGTDLVREAKTGLYDIVLMDLNMPGMSGLEAAASIRETDQDLPLVALTGSVDSTEKIKCIETGINLVLSKPVNFNVLKKALVLVTSDKVADDFIPCSKEKKNNCLVMTDVLDCACLLKNYGGNFSLTADSINSFIKCFPLLFANLKNAYYSDREDMLFRIHKLKGSALNAWALSIVKLLGRVEKKYNEGLLGISQETLKCIEKEFDRYKDEALKFYSYCLGL